MNPPVSGLGKIITERNINFVQNVIHITYVIFTHRTYSNRYLEVIQKCKSMKQLLHV